MKTISVSLCVLIFILMNSCTSTKQKADLLLVHGKVYTLDADFSICEAFAVKDGNIVATGTDSEIIGRYHADKVIDAKGKTVYPGFYDAHCHFYGYGTNVLARADLRNTSTYEEMLELLVEHNSAFDPTWVQGRGWDQNDWPGKEFPSNEKLDELFPSKPVYLIRIDGHAALVNTKALEIAGVTINTSVEGGELLLKNGRLTGVLIDNAMDLVRDMIPEPTTEDIAKAFLISQDSCLQYGLTSVADAGLEKVEVETIDQLQKDDKLKMRVYAMLSPTKENIDHFVKQGLYLTNKLSVRSVKLYADGALGSRGAKMVEPYSDDPENSGLILHAQDHYDSLCQVAYDNGYQINIHAIGDGGVRLSLETFGRFLKGQNDRRWRIEHSQVVHPDDFELFGKYSIVPSVQATHATSDMYWAGDRLGEERIKNAYAYKQLLNQLEWLPNGTDFPIEQINPLLTYYASVFRKDAKGWPENGFQMENALSPEEALRSITIWAAKAGFEENQKGSLENSKVADFVIFENDFLELPEKEILKTKPLAVYIDGVCVFSRD